MEQYFLAVDIGASSGRHILGRVEKGRMSLEEIYRFPNGMKAVRGQLCWDLEELWGHVKAGMKKCKELGKIPVSMGVDTWAVDYVLLDSQDRIVGNTVGYRDQRTRGMDREVSQVISPKELYRRTGIQKQSFNTIYQLMALKQKKPQMLKAARKLLLTPDYFNYLLTGKAAEEYTIASTTQLLSPVTKTWDKELIGKLGYPEEIFEEIRMPGCELGNLKKKIREEIGFDINVVMVAAHDTGSAVMAIPGNEENVLYISSGTWSLMGTELLEADCSPESKRRNLSNEGGYDCRFRYLKNIMGLWMIQSVKKEIGADLSFGEICDMASKCEIRSLVDCNDERFLAPKNMTEEVRRACEESGQQVPEGIAQVAAVIYNSLARCYAATMEEIEGMTGCYYESIHIMGGGSNAEYLNRLTAKATGRKVLAGPVEATAIGNIAAQMIAEGELKDLQEARNCIYQSFPIMVYE